MKKILFIGIDYYNYTKEIIKTMELMGYHVTFYPLRLMSFYDRVLHTIAGEYFQKKMDKYHQMIIEKEKNNHYDVLFFLQVHFMSIDNIEKLKATYTSSEFILYNWDSIITHDYTNYIKYFNKVFTFDYNDAKNYNLNYLPLFATEQYIKLDTNRNKKQIYFVGNVCHTERFRTLVAFIKYCKKEEIEFNHYICCTPVAIFKLLCDGIFPWHFHFFRASREKMKRLLTSGVVFDCRNHTQSGYTMRIIENICSGRKIITDNTHLKSESFYSEDRFFIYEEENFDGIKEFMNVNIVEENRDFSDLYIESFVKKMLL